MELSISVSELLPTKENIGNVASNIIELCNSGLISPIELAVKLSALEKVCEQVREGISEQVLTELAKDNGKTTCLSAKIERKEVGTKYNFESCEAWTKVKEKENFWSDKRKEIETISKNCPEGAELNFTDTSTGETWNVIRASKTSKTSFAVTLSKD
jgi:hypothetical protein